MSANLPDETVPGPRRWPLGLAAVSVLASVVAMAQSPARPPGAEPAAGPAPAKSPVTQQGGAVMPSPNASQAGKEREVAVLAGGCFWECRTSCARSRRARDRGRLHGRLGAQPALRGHPRLEIGPRGSRPDRLRSARPFLRRPAGEVVLPHARPHHAQTGKGTTRAPSTGAPSSWRTTRNRAVAEARQGPRPGVGPLEGDDHDGDRAGVRLVQGRDYHQDYLEKHSGGYTCHFLRTW